MELFRGKHHAIPVSPAYVASAIRWMKGRGAEKMLEGKKWWLYKVTQLNKEKIGVRWGEPSWEIEAVLSNKMHVLSRLSARCVNVVLSDCKIVCKKTVQCVKKTHAGFFNRPV